MSNSSSGMLALIRTRLCYCSGRSDQKIRVQEEKVAGGLKMNSLEYRRVLTMKRKRICFVVALYCLTKSTL